MRGVSIDTASHLQVTTMDIFIKVYIYHLFMVLVRYHGLNTSPGLQCALLVLHWDACVIPLQHRVELHAGWPLTGREASAMLNYGGLYQYKFILL